MNIATVNTPAMVKEMIGVGSQYALNALDTEGAYLADELIPNVQGSSAQAGMPLLLIFRTIQT